MIKQEIIEKISKYFKLTQYEAEKIYDDIFSGIIQGVKDDNIADITNLGEFIIKYDNGGTGGKKNVEFLPTLSLEEEINQRSFEEQRTFEPAPYVNPLEAYEEDKRKETETTVPPVLKEVPDIFESTEETGKKEPVSQSSLAEEEIKRRRDEILSKITTPRVEKQTSPLEKENIIVPPVVVTSVFSEEKKLFEEKATVEQAAKLEEEAEKTVLSSTSKIEQEISSKVTDSSVEEKNEVNKMSESSFSDFFSELNDPAKNTGIPLEKTELPRKESVIPPSAVELHNELTGEKNKSSLYQSAVTQPPVLNSNGSGDSTEHKLNDSSYYIWYKDSEPNVADTQTMSYEYELLYQATKEAEYKSKLRIYVTTFIMFFSVVLILLIFSPVIYKYFFTPKETDQNTEEVQDESGINQVDPNTNPADNNTGGTQQNNAGLTGSNTPPVTGTEANNTAPVTEQPRQEAPKQEVPKQEAPKQEVSKKETPKQNVTGKKESTKEKPKKKIFKKDQTKKEPVTQQKTTSPSNDNSTLPKGITKNSMGWLDDVNKVMYIQLENGKFTIQESAWDSEAKANKRISSVESFISGLKGTAIAADMGAKGTWYRARFGEFSTIDEARVKAAELRSKEKTRLHALILSILLYA
jgi:nucleoid DNA-binding protein